MSRRIITIIFIAGLIATFLLKPQFESHDVLGMPNFTVITRTSTPKPVPPTATESNDNGGNNPPPQNTATATPIPHTPTPTLIPVTLVATPVGGFLPTAVACGFPPTIQAQNTTRIRTGPGTDFDILGELVYLETKPVVGRAADEEWWVIQFTNNEIGWVADAVVIVTGNTSGVPIITEPEGENPTWIPTPNPECPITPSPTPAPTETSTNIPEVTATGTPLPTDTPLPEPTAEPITEEPEPTVEETEPTATATSVIPTIESSEAETEVEQVQPTAEPLPEDPPSAVSALPCATSMIGLAVIGFLLFRRIF